jgi:hypothetical protein
MTQVEHRRRRRGVFRQHSLGLAVAAILIAWFVLYLRSDPSTHLGAFYGNALADWLGVFVIVIATKYFYEIGSAESRRPHPRSRRAAVVFLVDHSLTVALLVSGALWVAIYVNVDANGRAGQVIGNIVSEWTQLLGLIVMTKYLHEIGSHEH